MKEVILRRCNCGPDRSGREDEISVCCDCGGYILSDLVDAQGSDADKRSPRRQAMTPKAETPVVERLRHVADRVARGYADVRAINAIISDLERIAGEIAARAAKIKAANEGPDSYYHVAGDEPVDFVLDDELIAWAAQIAAARREP